ncbi:hypothetical protein LOK49_LG05G02162 [Camellia lanceoleosa]|uniref:Uncharacterized protein n=1 Tax=Camellia lanceoleosa TaxID=1840588 RepID=A0ACC0HMV9_9ERIC|nr:hypothetical protein LOK49_LG05G02162 [Camellia lanceoleosa]
MFGISYSYVKSALLVVTNLDQICWLVSQVQSLLDDLLQFCDFLVPFRTVKRALSVCSLSDALKQGFQSRKFAAGMLLVCCFYAAASLAVGVG